MSEMYISEFNPANGRLVCSPEHPMPQGAAGRWEHTNVEDAGECLDGCCDYYRCKDCGHTWRQKVASMNKCPRCGHFFGGHFFGSGPECPYCGPDEEPEVVEKPEDDSDIEGAAI